MCQLFPWNHFYFSFYFLFLCYFITNNSQTLVNIAHRGASGDLPENTLAAYNLALDHGADIIEMDLGITKDLVFVAIHDVKMSLTTNIAKISEFASRRRINNFTTTTTTTTTTNTNTSTFDWFITDFNYSELQNVKCRQRYAYRNHSFDNLYSIPTLKEVIHLILQRNTKLIIELKLVNFYNKHVHKIQPHSTIVQLLLNELESHNFPKDRLLIQSLYFTSLLEVRKRNAEYITIYLMNQFISPNERKELFAELFNAGIDAIGTPEKYLQFKSIKKKNVKYYQESTRLMQLAHRYSLVVFVWTLTNDAKPGINYVDDYQKNLSKYYCSNVDGIMHEHPLALTSFMKGKKYKNCLPEKNVGNKLLSKMSNCLLFYLFSSLVTTTI